MAKKINWKKIALQHKTSLIACIFGVAFVLIGIILIFLEANFTSTQVVEVLEKSKENSPDIVIEVAGEVKKPGVYTFTNGSRVHEALSKAEGLTAQADLEWVGKTLNQAALLEDGQKIYIPKVAEQLTKTTASSYSPTVSTQTSSFLGVLTGVNINSATKEQLESLPGIGPAYAQKIIDNRSYSTTDELLSKGILGKSLYEKIKGNITIY